MKWLVILFLCWFEIQWGYQNIEGYYESEAQLIFTMRF